MRISFPPGRNEVLVDRVGVSARRAAAPGPSCCVRSMRLLTFARVLRLESGLECNLVANEINYVSSVMDTYLWQLSADPHALSDG